MGFGGISIWSLLLILAIVILLFGTKKLRNVGADLGGAIKNFKKSVKDQESVSTEETTAEGQVIEGKVTENKDKAS
jgi:sec-independent protein translocase protein TatA